MSLPSRDELEPEVRDLADWIAGRMPDEYPYGYAVHLALMELEGSGVWTDNREED